MKLESFRNKTFKMHNEIEQIAAKALGYYPAYRDDPKNFPNVSPDDDSVCIGDHVTETIVAELAEKYKFLKAENNKLTRLLEMQRPKQMANAMSVCIAVSQDEYRDLGEKIVNLRVEMAKSQLLEALRTHEKIEEKFFEGESK